MWEKPSREIRYGLILAEIMEPCDFAIFVDQNIHLSVMLSGQPNSDTWNKMGVLRAQGKMKNDVAIMGDFLFWAHRVSGSPKYWKYFNYLKRLLL